MQRTKRPERNKQQQMPPSAISGVWTIRGINSLQKYISLCLPKIVILYLPKSL